MFLDYGHFGGGKSRTYLDSMLKDLDDMHNKMNAGDMTYRDIEIDGMKELLKENELEIARLRKELSKLREEIDRLRKINNELTDKFNQTLYE